MIKNSETEFLNMPVKKNFLIFRIYRKIESWMRAVKITVYL